MRNITENKEFKDFVTDVKARIYKAQYDALKAVNKELIQLYWDIGKMIVSRQEKMGWGKSVIENLAKDLQGEFIGVEGFSSRNLWRMRTFYTVYNNRTNLPPMVAEIGWSHNVVIMEKCKDESMRNFYIVSAKKFGWTKDVLIHQINNKTYEKYLLNQTSFDKTIPQKYKNQAKLAVKDHYTFDFLELSDEHSEKELEAALIRNIRKFLEEMGSYYTFMGSQYRLVVSTKEYFVDLVLFHRQLRCIIAIELKIGEFLPEHKGKMEFYLTALNKQVKLKDENDSIGIIICKSKDKTVVEYSLSNATHPIGIATYNTTPQLPANYKKYLPSKTEIEKRLSDFLNNKEKKF